MQFAVSAVKLWDQMFLQSILDPVLHTVFFVLFVNIRSSDNLSYLSPASFIAAIVTYISPLRSSCISKRKLVIDSSVKERSFHHICVFTPCIKRQDGLRSTVHLFSESAQKLRTGLENAGHAIFLRWLLRHPWCDELQSYFYFLGASQMFGAPSPL